MKKLRRGVRAFKKNAFKKHQKLFKELAKGQSPLALFITCSDSRVDPNLITGSKPGELFVLRNIGAIAPPFAKRDLKTCTGSAVEYAVDVLNVPDIIVCTHSGCGALKALYASRKELAGKADLKRWISAAREAKTRTLKDSTRLTTAKRNAATEKNHVVGQLKNLLTYPVVSRALKAGSLKIHGWHYDIATGVVMEYDDHSGEFVEI